MPCRLAAVQIDIALGRIEDNLARITDQAEKAAADGAQLVVFPECAVTGYAFDSLDEARPFAEPIPGPTTERLGQLCRRLEIHLVTGMLEADRDRLFNAAVLVGPQGLVGSSRKVHLPMLGIDRFATPGDRPFQVWDTPLGRIGMLICYDLSFPEAARVLMLQGADLIVLPTNWPPGAELTAEHLVAGRALENHVFCRATNRVGRERGFRFIGASRIADPHGRTLAQAGPDEETRLIADVELADARQKRIVRVPDKHTIDRLLDRRPEMYGPICEPRTPK